MWGVGKGAHWGWEKGLMWKSKATHSSSKMAIMRDASGLLAICGICRNSLRSIEPEPSLFHVIGACEQVRAEGSGVGVR